MITSRGESQITTSIVDRSNFRPDPVSFFPGTVTSRKPRYRTACVARKDFRLPWREDLCVGD